MRILAAIIGALAVADFTSCTSWMTIDGVPVYGKVGLLSTEQIRAAIAADQSSPSQPSNKIYAVEVISTTEIHVHHAPWNPSIWQYNEILKLHGKWRKPQERVVGGASRI
jgi:hypothetical protein